jgi:hypothetical protein
MKTKVRIKLPNGYYQLNTVWLEPNPEKAYKWGGRGRRQETESGFSRGDSKVSSYELEARRIVNSVKRDLTRLIELHPYCQGSQAEQDCLAALDLLKRIDLSNPAYTQQRRDEE